MCSAVFRVGGEGVLSTVLGAWDMVVPGGTL